MDKVQGPFEGGVAAECVWDEFMMRGLWGSPASCVGVRQVDGGEDAGRGFGVVGGWVSCDC